IRWWTRQKQRPPLLMSEKELRASTDVFSMELIDMKQHHKVLFGKDLLAELEIPMRSHRAQLEYELREKLILLRQRLLAAAEDEGRILDLLLHSVPAFITLFRHVLIAQGRTPPVTRIETLKMLILHRGPTRSYSSNCLKRAKTLRLKRDWPSKKRRDNIWRSPNA